MGYVRNVMYLALASAGINLVLSIALMGPLGVLGVIVGTLVGYSIVWYPYMRLFLRVFELRWSEFARRTAIPILLVCVPWTVGVLLFHLEVNAGTLAGAVAAIGLSVVSGWVAILFLALRPEERRVLLANTRSLVGLT